MTGGEGLFEGDMRLNEAQLRNFKQGSLENRGNWGKVDEIFFGIECFDTLKSVAPLEYFAAPKSFDSKHPGNCQQVTEICNNWERLPLAA